MKAGDATQQFNKINPCVFEDLHSAAVDGCFILEYDAASRRKRFPTFRRNLMP